MKQKIQSKARPKSILQYSKRTMSKLIIANWKSQKTLDAAQKWWNDFSSLYQESAHCTVVVAPSFTLLSSIEVLASDTGIHLGAQDVSPFPMGSYTGGVNAQQLRDVGVEYVIVGHSERRQHFHETSQDVAKKIREVLSAGMTPIVCVDKEYIDEQASLLNSEEMVKCVLAYEPVAAIGSGQPEDVGTVGDVIKKIKSVFGPVPVIYGGSVNEINVQEYVLVSDGALVGSASLDGEKFATLVNSLH